LKYIDKINFKEISEVLENISSNYNKLSKEYQTLELCAFMAFYIWHNKINSDFLEFIKQHEKKVSQKQINILKSLGLIK
jgi:hypothetical protein